MSASARLSLAVGAKGRPFSDPRAARLRGEPMLIKPSRPKTEIRKSSKLQQVLASGILAICTGGSGYALQASTAKGLR